MSDLCENLCVQKKRAKLIQEGRCFICCNTGCYVKKCKKEVCSYCKDRHARAICFKLEKSKQNSHLDLEEKNVDVKTTSSNSVFHNRGGVLLQCVKAEIIGRSSSDKIFCLFDNGSSDFYWSLTHRIKRLDSSLVAVETRLGWSLQGKCDEWSDCTLVHLVHSEEESISTELRRFWEIESLVILDKGSVTLGNGDEEILSEFDKSVNFVDGRYRVNLPWKPGMREALQNNKTVAPDVKSAFLQIELDFRDRDFTRFFWTDNLNNEPYVLNFTRVLFGLRPSPYLLATTLKHHFKKYREQYPHTFELLNSSIYVDDLICCQNDVPDALRTTLECLQIFSDAGMLLRKWRSNSKQLNLLWQQEGVKTESSETSAIDLRPPTKVLGLAWDPENDLIYFDPKDLLKFMSRRAESKRFILAVIGRIFDPIGILGPFVIKLKCLLQELWTLGVEWDSELPPKLRHKWHQWSSEAEGLTEIKIPRFYLGNIDQEISKCEIHCFSDASKSAYGTILYLRFVTCNNEIETSFICSKSRVAPLKSLTLPRLELTAALLSARLAKQVSSCLKFDANIYYWTDSLISYYWIRGVSATLTQLRKKYWIPKGRQLVKTMIRICLVCKKYSAKPADQLSGQLPRDRITQSPPFQIVGIDFTGAILVKDNQGTRKSYVSLFTCAVTRALHLELVSDMSTKCFLLALRRFLARRGNCKVIYSDNARTFKAAERELAYFANILKDSEFQNFVADKGIHWKFIVERAPWWGGFYERLVKTIKDPLRKILGRALLTFEELSTILSEVEVIVNHRPVTYVENDPGEPEPLTPAHFLELGYGDSKYPIHFIELIDTTTAKESYKKRKTYRTLLLKQLWRRWKEQYLLQFKTANHFKTPSVHKSLKLNDVVLVEGNVKSKLLWELGIIKEIVIGRETITLDLVL
ncbi:integrase catalytic domain-containing protein [Trichonephila clavipes]|nr:integrase catalytic domain-containing protein [Trichonephila clavipes]